MHEELKDLFSGRRPSISSFNQYLEKLSSKEKHLCKKRMFVLALSCFSLCSKPEQSFLGHLVVAYRQEFLDFLRNDTILGQIRYPLQQPEQVRKLLTFAERSLTKPKSSLRHLAFSLLLAFNYGLTIDTLCNQMRENKITAEDLWEWYEDIMICGDD